MYFRKKINIFAELKRRLTMDKIIIKGYKSFGELDFNLRNINLLIGANGAGKSNFLSLFEMLGRIFNQGLEQYVAMKGGVDKFLHQGRKVTSVIETQIAQDKCSYKLSLIEADGKLLVHREQLGYKEADTWDYATISAFVPEAKIKTYSGMERADYVKEYLGQIRRFHFHDTGSRSKFASECHVKNDAQTLYEHGENLAPILYRIQQENPMVYRRIVQVIQSVAPYFLDFYFNPSPADTMRLLWQDRFSTMIYGPNDFSDGTIRFIALVVLFMQPWLPKVIIIDEPELGLHPVAIQKLSGLIKIAAQRGTQIIIATQSAELISNFDPEDVVTVNQKEGMTQMERLNSEELSHWLDDYTLGDLWKQNILKGGQPR